MILSINFLNYTCKAINVSADTLSTVSLGYAVMGFMFLKGQ